MTTPNRGDNMAIPFDQDLISEIFGQRPNLALLGAGAQQGLRPHEQRFLQQRPSQFLPLFEQSIANQLFGGQVPTGGPQDFFSNLNLRNEINRFSPEQRGVERSRFAPRTRFFFPS